MFSTPPSTYLFRIIPIISSPQKARSTCDAYPTWDGALASTLITYKLCENIQSSNALLFWSVLTDHASDAAIKSPVV